MVVITVISSTTIFPINGQLKNSFYSHPKITSLLETHKKAVATNEIWPFAAAQELLKKYFG